MISVLLTQKPRSNIGNGEIGAVALNTGKAKREIYTYMARSKILVKKAEEIVNVTGCEAFVDIIPTWQRGKHWLYNQLVTPMEISLYTKIISDRRKVFCKPVHPT